MNDTALQRALLATARVAGAVALFGCAPTTASVLPEPTTSTAVDSDVVDEPDEDGECAGLLDELVEQMSEDPSDTEVDRPTRACCTDLVDDIETNGWSQENDPGDALWVCCAALDYPVGLACTPWGPPAPPDMLPALA